LQFFIINSIIKIGIIYVFLYLYLFLGGDVFHEKVWVKKDCLDAWHFMFSGCVFKYLNFAADGKNVVLGDVNGDSKINAIDVLLMKKYILKVINDLPSDGVKAADVNADGQINSID